MVAAAQAVVEGVEEDPEVPADKLSEGKIPDFTPDKTRGDDVLDTADAKGEDQATASEVSSFAQFWNSIMQADEPPKVLATPDEYKVGGALFAKISNFFHIKDRGSTFWIEFVGGMTTFFSMCYIMALNSIIIAGYFNTGIPAQGVFFATTLTSAVFTFCMGVFVNVPVALAPGMGLNGYFNNIAGSVCWGAYGAASDPGPGATAEQLMDAFKYIQDQGGCPSWGVSKLPWTDAMGAVFISGWFYLFFTLTGLRSMLFRAVPPSLRAAITVGIGFFITIIGLKIGQLTRVTQAPWSLGGVLKNADCYFTSDVSVTGFGPVPPIGFCNNPVDLNFATYELGFVSLPEHPEGRIAVLGLAFVALFTVMRVKGAIILSITLATLIGINYSNPVGVFYDDKGGKNGAVAGHLHKMVPSMSTSGKGSTFIGNDPRLGVVSPQPVSAVTNLASWFAYDKAYYNSGLSGKQQRMVGDHFFLPNMKVIPSGMLSFKYARTPLFWDAVWTFLFVELFDSFGTLTGVMTRAGFMKKDPEKAMTKVNRAMLVDGCSLWMGGLIGANSCTCYIESNTGIEAGARTGFASVVTGCAFFLSLIFVFPFVAVIPDAATTCALVMVGVYSLEGVQEINFSDIADQLAAFFCIATMGFTYSIANGICTGFIFFAWMRTARFLVQKFAVKFRPAMAYDETVDCTLPHPLMLVMAAFAAVRFQYLSPGHQ